MTIYDHWLYRFLTGPLNNVAWLYILLPCVFAGGIYLTVGSGAVQFRRFGYAMKNTAGKLFKKQETAHGAITPLQAVTTALAATVGTGNIIGTSQAIAMGGYGAVMSEAYPTEARATAQNLLFNIGRGVGGLGPVVVGAVAMAYGFQMAIALLAAIYVLDMIATALCIPELKGKELQ